MNEVDQKLKALTLINRTAVVLALIFGLGLLAVMAIKPISAMDLGYHLAYGNKHLVTGKTVSDASFIHPRPTPSNSSAELYPLAPGSGFDREGNYRFPNANWLTQYILAVCWRSGRWAALNFVLLWLIIMIGLGQLYAAKKLNLPPLWAVVCWLAICLIGYERFLLRPELFAFAVLIWQFAIIAGGKIGRRSFVIVLALQVLAVNLHSYWLLAIGITGSFAFEKFLLLIACKIKNSQDDSAELKKQFAAFTALTVLMTLSAAIHPARWSNIVYPFKTLQYLSDNHISGQNRQQVTANFANKSIVAKSTEPKAQKFHPWQTIGEFHKPFSKQSLQTLSTRSFIALLICAVIAACVLVWQKKWALLAITLAMCMVGQSMRRNIIIPAIIISPIIIWSLLQLLKIIPLHENAGLKLKLCSAIVISGICIWLGSTVVTGSFYYKSGRLAYFGTGPSELAMPLKSCSVLDKIFRIPQPVFANQNITSTIVFFSRKTSSSATLTNTWACPPSFMARSLDICSGKLSPDNIAAMGFKAAVIQAWPENIPLIRRLNASTDWALVDIDGAFCTYIYRTDTNTEKISTYEIFRSENTAHKLLESIPEKPIIRAMKLQTTAATLQHMMWDESAILLWQACVETPIGAQIASNWLNLGVSLARQSSARAKMGDRSAIDKLIRARRAFCQALELDGDYSQAKINLRQVDKDLTASSQPNLLQ